MNIAVLFGSKSDEYIYTPLVENLEKNHRVNFQVISPHLELEKLKLFLEKEKYDVVVAGAGLAAHLPGVAASLTERPVFGIPVETCFGGLDALLSMVQLPYGVPVLTSSPYDQTENHSLLKFIPEIEARKEKKVTLSVGQSALHYEYVHLEYKRLKDLGQEKGFKFDETHSIESLEMCEGFVINFVHEDDRCSDLPQVINVPIFENNMKREASRVLTIHQWVASGGMWVGVNNTCNALLFIEKIKALKL